MEAKYDRIGVDYNNTRKADPYLLSRMIHHLAPITGKRYGDIGCGTGNYSRAIFNTGVDLIGIDPSLRMLQKARESCPEMDWRQGSAESNGLDDNSLDGILASLTLHHWNSLEEGFGALSKVLCSMGKFVIFTSLVSQMEQYWLNHYFPKMLEESTRKMPSYAAIGSALTSTGIRIVETERYFVKPDLEDLFLQCGKSRPEMYLDPVIRNGISSFTADSNKEEVDAGLIRLEADIRSDRIREVIASYDDSLGDYMFIIGEKDH